MTDNKPVIIDPFDPRANADTFDWDGFRAVVEQARLKELRDQSKENS